jgi:hypothetical protein
MSVRLAKKRDVQATGTLTARLSAQKGQDAPVNEAMVNDDPRLLDEAQFEVGDVSHQGDLMVVRVHCLPEDARPRGPQESRQLAPGETQGSRHVLERGRIYDCDVDQVRRLIQQANGCDVNSRYIGPMFVSPLAPTEHDLTHPEHGHQGFPAGAVCAVVHQRVLDQDEQERRALD